ncbi:TRAP transporter substrate-binding protein [Mesobaculum littorinae]|uniref:TRAP transporter substrate-binding protein n=1 Tax=Mesobaculum littorinae TaxID=2486419 RepID=A0A438AHE7_9RHOB|nr:TRAP transporter substrate-binding protein [Mesobaculum littorinae]RVV98153.1 TRAP transporter substrate-binding protein [Mesobaculum littorinae]
MPLDKALLSLPLALLALPAGAQEFTAKIGNLEAPQAVINQMIEKVGDLVSERTDGAVEFQLFPSGQLGPQREMTEAVQLGTLEATVAPIAFLGGFNPEASIVDIPFLYPADETAAQEIRAGEFGTALCESFESRGTHCVGLWPNGRKQFTSNTSMEDMDAFQNQTFRVMESSILQAQMEALGATAVPLPFGELYTALQTGVVEGQENPLDTIFNMKFHEVQDYLLVSNHGVIENVILFNPMFWDSLPEEYRATITEAFAEVIPELIEKKAEAGEEALQVIRDSGTEVRELSEEETAAFRAAMYAPAREAYLDRAGTAGQTLIDLYEEAYATATQ